MQSIELSRSREIPVRFGTLTIFFQRNPDSGVEDRFRIKTDNVIKIEDAFKALNYVIPKIMGECKINLINQIVRAMNYSEIDLMEQFKLNNEFYRTVDWNIEGRGYSSFCDNLWIKNKNESNSSYAGGIYKYEGKSLLNDSVHLSINFKLTKELMKSDNYVVTIQPKRNIMEKQVQVSMSLKQAVIAGVGLGLGMLLTTMAAQIVTGLLMGLMG